MLLVISLVSRFKAIDCATNCFAALCVFFVKFVAFCRSILCRVVSFRYCKCKCNCFHLLITSAHRRVIKFYTDILHVCVYGNHVISEALVVCHYSINVDVFTNYDLLRWQFQRGTENAGRSKMHGWKTRHQTAGLVNARKGTNQSIYCYMAARWLDYTVRQIIFLKTSFTL